MTRGPFSTDTRGATAVEFALTAPLFIAMLFGVIQVGLMLWTQFSMQHAVEAAARCASTGACVTSSDVQSYAVQYAIGLGFSPSVFTAASPGCGHSVQAAYTFYFVSNSFPSPSIPLHAQACTPSPI